MSSNILVDGMYVRYKAKIVVWWKYKKHFPLQVFQWWLDHVHNRGRKYVAWPWRYVPSPGYLMCCGIWLWRRARHRYVGGKLSRWMEPFMPSTRHWPYRTARLLTWYEQKFNPTHV